MALHPGLEIFTTADGSPTLSFTREDGYIEKMHHSGGAMAESLYIYHHGLVKALDLGMPARVISVGLGLGYNELIATAEFTRRGIDGKIWSFEAMPYLRDSFRAWLSGEAEAEYTAVLDQVCAGIEKHFGIGGLKGLVRAELRGPFPQDTAEVSGAGVVFFDAFSNKMSPELWREMDLEKNLAPLLADRALLCTYAKTGALKRVLKNLGFKMEDRPGFQGKRDSTLALR